jgi:hypothetical protein
MKTSTSNILFVASMLSGAAAFPSFEAQGTISQQALSMPGVKALEFLRGADPRALERCVDAPEDCRPDILQQLEVLQQHKGIAMLNDVMLVDFCARSPFASSLNFCQGRDAKAMIAHLHKFSDDEYMNQRLLSCVRGSECMPTTRTHLDNLLLEPEALVPIEHILMYLCHHANYADQLAVCVAESDIVQWKPARKIPKTAQHLPGVQAFQALRRADIVQLAHCASDAALCPPQLLVELSDLQKHKGILALNDAVLVFFCQHSRFSSKLQVCREHTPSQLIAHLHKLKDSEYHTAPLIGCVRTGLSVCAPRMRAHLEQLAEKPEVLVSIQHILKFMCHMTSIRHSLAVCIKDAAMTSPRQQILKRLQIRKYAIMTDHAKKAMLF